MIVLLLTIIACCNAELLTTVDHASHIRFPSFEYLPRSDGYPIGHKEPLGSQRPPVGQIPEYFISPTPKEHWDKSVKAYTPSVIRGALRDSPALTKWTDEYLIKEYGEEEATVETSVEDRSKKTKRMTLKGYLDVYKKRNWYIVSVLPANMRKDIRTPTPLMCGSFVDELLEEDLWVGAGGTRSVVHYDALNIIHCLVSGRKDWILIHPKYRNQLDMVTSLQASNSGFSHIPVTSIDYDVHPEVWDIPWHYATLRPGDCLYLPSKYIHHVKSYNRSISATFLVYPRERFSYKNCKGIEYDSYKNHSEVYVPWTYETGQETMDMGYTLPKNHRYDVLRLMKTIGVTWMTPRIFAYFIQSQFGNAKGGKMELFRGLDQDKDNNVTVDEIENSDIIIWKEFARATNKEGHGPTKSQLKENINLTNDSIEFEPNIQYEDFDVENAKFFLKFLIRVKGVNHAISQPEFDKWVVTQLESVSSIFKKLDFNSDGFLSTREIDRVQAKKIRDFSRAYYQLKGTHINSGGIHIHEIFRTNLKYLENMNKIPDEVLITKEEEQEQEEAKRPGGDDDFLIGFLNEMKKYVESAPNKQLQKQQFLDEMPRSERFLEFLDVSTLDYKFLFYLLDRGQKGYIVPDDIDFYMKNERPPTEPLREFEDDNPDYIQLNHDLPAPRDLLGIFIQEMIKWQAKFDGSKQNAADKEGRDEL